MKFDNYPFVEVYFDSPGVQNGYGMYIVDLGMVIASNVNDIALTQNLVLLLLEII